MLNNSNPNSALPGDMDLVQPVPLFAMIGQRNLGDKMVVELKLLGPNGAAVYLLDAAQATTLFTNGLEVARLTQAGLSLPH